jgi:nucleoside 2-deoxyribosyltransferase
MDEKIVCQICGSEAQVEWWPKGRIRSVTCGTCGNYGVTLETLAELKSLQPNEKFKISAYLKERTIRGDPTIVLFREVPSTTAFDFPVEAVKNILLTGFPSTVSDRLDRGLMNLRRLSPNPGYGIQLNIAKEYPVLFAEDKEAGLFFLNALYKKGFIEFDYAVPVSIVKLTVEGWNRIIELELQKANKDSRQAFVAMWFDPGLDNVYKEGIEKAIEDAGYKARRVDLKEHNEKICDMIIAEIRKSRFVVADFTGHREGVYYEAGYAKGLGLEVVWTCREDEFGKTHFDTRQYNHIIWKNEQDLYQQLRRRIEATII